MVVAMADGATTRGDVAVCGINPISWDARPRLPWCGDADRADRGGAPPHRGCPGSYAAPRVGRGPGPEMLRFRHRENVGGGPSDKKQPDPR